jgi:YD repeat-containing protein
VVIQDGTYAYVYGLDLISMTDGSGNQKYFSYDGLGSVTDITNGSGTVTDTFVYDVFGAVTARTGSSATIGKFTGAQADDATA